MTKRDSSAQWLKITQKGLILQHCDKPDASFVGMSPQKGGIRFQIRKVRHFCRFYPIVLLLSSQTELESGILKWDSKKFFVNPTTFEGHLMRHLHKFGQ